MGVFDNESFLPGVITEIESDYSYGYDSSQFGTTDSVLVIGTAFDGPTGVPVKIYSPEHASYVFGKVYDYKTKQEATLVPALADAYNRGCRTMYAVRVTGKQIYKDFELRVDDAMRLRVSGVYPSNNAKDVYMQYDATPGDEKIKIFKPASRATIAEKMQGMVESDTAVMVVELKLNRDYGLGADSKLVEVIRLVNDHMYNNVLKLQLIDDTGADITNTPNAFGSTLGMLFPGVYYIGRGESKCAAYTNVKFNVVTDENSAKPFPSFDGVFFRTLDINTDVATPYPIFASDKDQFKAILNDVEITMIKDWDFLETRAYRIARLQKTQWTTKRSPYRASRSTSALAAVLPSRPAPNAA